MSDQPRRRGPKPLSPAVLQGPQFVKHTPADIAATQAAMYAAGELPTPEEVVGWTQSSLLAGRIQSALVQRHVAARIIAESYAALMESNSYVGTPYVDADGSRRHVAALDEFCTVFFGRSARRCRELAANLDTLGADLFEAAEKIGLGQRDYNALKALPADDQAVVKQALADGGDREAVTGMLVGLTERLSKKLEKKTHEYESLAKRDGELTQQLDEAKARAALLPRLKPDAKAADMLVDLQADMVEARAKLRQAMRSVEVFHQHLREYDIDAHDSELAALMVELLQLVVAPVPELAIGGIPQPLDFLKTIV